MSTDTLAQATAPAAGLAIECLCPFCGALNRGTVGRPCPQCGTEDTTAARAAARKRVGPWFVLAPRNPAAPGVSFPALLGMIRAGTVSERSVVRGPATGQLWRLAGKVRGLSREFGLCYGCGGELTVLDPACPHCQRPQSLPADVDADSAASPTPAAPAPVDRGYRPPPKADLLTHRDVAKAFSLGFTPGATPPPPTPAREPVQAATTTLDDLLPRGGNRPPAGLPRPATLAAVAGGVLAVLVGGWSIGRALTHRPVDGDNGPAVTMAADPAAAAARLSARTITFTHTSTTPAADRPTERPTDRPAEPAAVVAAATLDPVDAPGDNPKALMTAALNDEAAGDYPAAVRQYEHVESLSSDQWPADLKDRLKLARAAAKGD